MLLRPVSRLAPARTRAHVHAFGSPEYWTGFYADPRHERFEWFVDAERALALVRPRLRALRADRVLHVGAGTSALGPALAADGVGEVVNLDADADACRLAEGAWRARGGARARACSWHAGDARDLPARWSGRFDAAVDKGTTDALVFAGGGDAARALREIGRCLRPGGELWMITDDPPEDRVELLRDSLPQWAVSFTEVSGEAAGADSWQYYLYTAQKPPGR